MGGPSPSPQSPHEARLGGDGSRASFFPACGDSPDDTIVGLCRCFEGAVSWGVHLEGQLRDILEFLADHDLINWCINVGKELYINMDKLVRAKNCAETFYSERLFCSWIDCTSSSNEIISTLDISA